MPIAKVPVDENRVHKAGSAQKHIEARGRDMNVRRSKVKKFRVLPGPHTGAALQWTDTGAIAMLSEANLLEGNPWRNISASTGQPC